MAISGPGKYVKSLNMPSRDYRRWIAFVVAMSFLSMALIWAGWGRKDSTSEGCLPSRQLSVDFSAAEGLLEGCSQLTSGLAVDVKMASQMSEESRKHLIISALELQARLESTGLPQARESLFEGMATMTGGGDIANLLDKRQYAGKVGETVDGAGKVQPGHATAFPACMDGVGTSQYGEDRMIFDKYFRLPQPLLHGVFFEMGAHDGWKLSNSYFFEQCLSWSGVLVEGHPDHFSRLKRHRTSPRTKRLWMGCCDEDGGTLTFSKKASDVSVALDQTTSAHKKKWGDKYGDGSIEVPCGPLGKYLNLLGVNRIDFFSLDVEGAELFVLQTVDWSKLSVHVLMVESVFAYGDEIDPLHEMLTKVGFDLEPRNTVLNSFVYVNRSFV